MLWSNRRGGGNKSCTNNCLSGRHTTMCSSTGRLYQYSRERDDPHPVQNNTIKQNKFYFKFYFKNTGGQRARVRSRR